MKYVVASCVGCWYDILLADVCLCHRPTIKSVERVSALYSVNAAAVEHLGIQTGQSELFNKREHTKKDTMVSALYLRKC